MKGELTVLGAKDWLSKKKLILYHFTSHVTTTELQCGPSLVAKESYSLTTPITIFFFFAEHFQNISVLNILIIYLVQSR